MSKHRNPTGLDGFILSTLRTYPDNEMTIPELHSWHAQIASWDNYQNFHFRDALYRLQDQGLVERTKHAGEKAYHWAIKVRA